MMSNIKPDLLPGEIYNKWTIIEKSGKYDRQDLYLCECKCGNQDKVRKSALITGRSKSCRKGICVPNFKDLTNLKVDRLTIINIKEIKERKIYWNCVCECGNYKVITTSDFNNKRFVKSCGCHYSDQNAKETYAMNDKFIRYKLEAKKRSYSFNLEFDYFKKLLKDNCYYCNKEPSNLHVCKNNSVIYNGIDRIDNNLGYEINNCVTSCYECNSKKHSVSLELVEKIYKLAKSRKLL